MQQRVKRLNKLFAYQKLIQVLATLIQEGRHLGMLPFFMCFQKVELAA